MKFSKEAKVGIVVVAAIGLFIYGFNFLGGKNLFNKNNYLYAKYEKVEGLLEANPLLLNGFKVGQVNKIQLLQKPSGDFDILVTFLLSEDINIPKDSKAKIYSSDLLGSKAVNLILGMSNEYLQSGDTIKPDYEDDLKTAVDKRIAPLQKKAENLISSIDSVMQVVTQVLNANVRQSLILTFESLKQTITSLKSTAGNLDTLMGTQKTRIAQILEKANSLVSNLEKNNDKISNIIANFSSISDSLAKANIKGTIENANLALGQANTILNQINSGQGSIGKLLKSDSIYNNLELASKDLDRLLKDLRINPERYVHLSVFGRRDRNKPKD